MASFFEPQEGANGLDTLVNYTLQKRRDAATLAATTAREDAKEALANQKANEYNLNKSFDPTNYDTDAIHQQVLSDKVAAGKKAATDYLMSPKADQNPYAFQKIIDDSTRDAVGYRNNVASLNQAISDKSGLYKGDKDRSQQAYQNAVYKKAMYGADGSLLPPNQVDVQSAIAETDAHPERFMANPTSSLQRNYLDMQKDDLVSTTKNEVDKGTGDAYQMNIKHRDLTYAGSPVKGADGNYNMQLNSVPFQDENLNPIAGRNVLAPAAMANLMGNEVNRQAITAMANKAYPDFDPSTKLGAQQMGETAYNFLKQNARLGVSSAERVTTGDPMKARIEEQRFQAGQQNMLLREMRMDRIGRDKVNKPDPFLDNALPVIAGDPSVVSGPIQTIKTGFPGVNEKTYQGQSVGATFPGGKVAVGLDKNQTIPNPKWFQGAAKSVPQTLPNKSFGHPVYATDVLRTDSGGIVVKMPDGSVQSYDTPLKVKNFFKDVAPINKSSAVRAAQTLDGDPAQPAAVAPKAAPSGTLINKIKTYFTPKKATGNDF